MESPPRTALLEVDKAQAMLLQELLSKSIIPAAAAKTMAPLWESIENAVKALGGQTNGP